MIIISTVLFIKCLVFDKFTLKGTLRHVQKKNITATNRDHVLFASVLVIVDKQFSNIVTKNRAAWYWCFCLTKKSLLPPP